MLIVGCSFCRAVTPLVHAGGFPPHPPVYIERTAMGPTCPYCGPMPPVFTCMNCGTVQGLFLPGMAPPQPGFGAPQLMAPTVEASPNAPKSQWIGLLETFVSAAGKSFGNDMGDQMGAWMGS